MKTMLKPRQLVPQLTVDVVGGGTWTLNDPAPEQFTMLVFYRGLHCPICRRTLSDLNRRVAAFAERGVDVIALSTDTAERAGEAVRTWELDRLRVGYGLTPEACRRWGLYLSSSRGRTSLGITEPDVFNEPGLFLIRPDGTLYAASIQTMPFARPSFADVLGAIDYVVANDYPARGEL